MRIGLCIGPWMAVLLMLPLSGARAGAPIIKSTSVGLRGESGGAIGTTADSMDYKQDTGEMVLRGHAVVTYGNTKLLADTIEVDSHTKQARASGHVRVRQGVRQWNSESLEMNLETGAMKAGRSRAQFERGLFVESRSMESDSRNRYVLKDSFVTTSDYDHPGYRLKASSVILYPKEKIVFHNVVLFVGSIPVFYFPYLVLMLDDTYDGLNTGTAVQMGSKSGWGFFVLNSYATSLTQDIRPTYRLDYRMERGMAGGADVRYKAGDPYNPDLEGELQPRVHGKVRAYYADDKKVRENHQVDVVNSTGTTSQQINPHRYQLRVSQRADLREDLYSKLKVNKLSDANFLQDYFEKEFQRDPQPDNFFEFTKWSPNTTLSLLARPQVNNFYTTTERLPELRFDLKRQRIPESPLFYEGENSVAYLSKQNARDSNLADYDATRVDTFHQILYPKQYFGWLNVTPRVNGRATFYDRSQLDAYQPSLVRTALGTGVEMGFKASRTWSGVHDKKLEIDGLRHVIEPSLNYGFTARPNHTPDQLNQFDVERSSYGISKDLAPINFPQYTGIDSIDRRNVFRPGLRQKLQTKRNGESVDLAELFVYQDILAQTNPGEKRYSDLFAEFSAHPLPWLSLNWVGRYDYDASQIRESNTSVTFIQKKDWKLSLSHNYFRTVGDQFGVEYAWQLNEDWTVKTQHRFDATKGELFEQSYAIERDFHSWIAALSFSQLRPLNHGSDLRIWLTFTLKAFPEMTLDSRQTGPVGGQMGAGSR